MIRALKNVIKYKLLRDWSIRSELFGRVRMADLAARFIGLNNVKGSYLEFGVFRGSTFSTFYHSFKKYDLQVDMYAFDSFQGLPRPVGIDATCRYDQFQAGQFSCSEKEFVDELAARWVPRSAYTIISGWYEETLTPELYDRIKLSRAAIVYIDCDLYESAKTALQWIRPIIQDGTLLIFDDYYCFTGHPEFGERRAFTEFLAETASFKATEYARFHTAGQAFIVHRI